MHHLPGQEQREPGHADEGGGAGTEDRVAGGRVAAVAFCCEVAVAPGEEDEGESAEAQGGHPDAVDEGVDDDFWGEDAVFLFIIRC